MTKAPDAFRTISEVSDILDTPPHVLRFWESKFAQLKPVKRAGGRRYYRPGDLALLGGIKRLLHEDGMTIRGVQKVLREQGVRHVAGLAPASMTIGQEAANDASSDTDLPGTESAQGGEVEESNDLFADLPPPARSRPEAAASAPEEPTADLYRAIETEEEPEQAVAPDSRDSAPSDTGPPEAAADETGTTDAAPDPDPLRDPAPHDLAAQDSEAARPDPGAEAAADATPDMPPAEGDPGSSAAAPDRLPTRVAELCGIASALRSRRAPPEDPAAADALLQRLQLLHARMVEARDGPGN